MRQFILAKNVAYAAGFADAMLSTLTEGAVGFFYSVDGVLTKSANGADLPNEFMLALGRSSANGGPVVLPIHKNKFTYAKGVYQAAKTFTAKFKVPAPTNIGEYSIIVVKKGVGFNERNKWTSSVHVVDTSMTAADLAAKLVKEIENKKEGSGVGATVEGDTITFTAVKAGVDYDVKGADLLMGVELTEVTAGEAAYGDAAYVKDLADKAAADAGFEYTYREANVDMYLNYPLNPLAQPDATDAGYTIFTLRFAEPRVVKPVDDVVNQVVQIAFPTGAAAITAFETVCKALAGIA